jgi:tetratricopeptide (TPR) repeat protein
VSDERRWPQLLAHYQEYLERPDSAIFCQQVTRRYTPGTLERLCRHPRREIRRAAVLALGFLGDYQANAMLGSALIDDDRTVRILAENSIRLVWTRTGEPRDRAQLEKIMTLNAARQFQKVVTLATELIGRVPAFSEAWNQRAYAHHGLGRFAESVRDCYEALEVNPYHFVAAVGMGRAYLELGNLNSALECFRRALRLNPDLEGIRAQADRIARIVEGKS